MKKELCFVFDGEKIYLEQSLIEYDCIPIYFICKSSLFLYISLCSDFDKFSYVVARVTVDEVYELLHGEIPMRDLITKQKYYWDVQSGDNIAQDIVVKSKIDELDKSILPIEGAVFEAMNASIKKYVENFDSEYFSKT